MSKYIIMKRDKKGNLFCLKKHSYANLHEWRLVSKNWYHNPFSVFDFSPINLAKSYKGFIVKVNSPKNPIKITLQGDKYYAELK